MRVTQVFGRDSKSANYSVPNISEQPHYVNFGGVLTFAAVERKEPPGAMVRFDGRLTTPSACPRIVRLSWLS